MSPSANQADNEGLQVRKCQQGDPEALAELREKSNAALLNILLARGAAPTEAEDILADLWADCVPGPGERPSLLEKFSGKCKIQAWLATVATNRWVDVKRKQTRRADMGGRPDEPGHNALEAVPAMASSTKEETLVGLLRDSLRAGFGACSPEAVVLLRLVYLHGLTQRELVRMLDWSEAKVSRCLSRAMEQVERHTLAQLKKRDPWLDLSWQDFVDLCETEAGGFL